MIWLIHGILIGSLLLPICSPVASAQSGQPTPEKFLPRFDRDHDGRVSREEFTGPPKGFARFDSNGDGFATRVELEAFFGGRIGAMRGPLAACRTSLLSQNGPKTSLFDIQVP